MLAGLRPQLVGRRAWPFCDLDHRHLQFLRENHRRGGLKATRYPVARNPCAPAQRSDTAEQILEQKGIAKIKVITRQLEDALARQDDAFQRRDSARYAAAAATAEDARSALASVPALTLAEILAKAKSLGPVPTTALASLSQGESALVASIIRDVRRMALRADAEDV